MKRLVFCLVMVPGAALAHGAEAVHLHPHGGEGLLLGLAVIALAAIAWWRA